MKKLFVFVFLLSVLNCTAQTLSNGNKIVNRSDYNVQNFADSCLNSLGVDSVLIMVVPTSELINSRYEGLCIRNNEKIFTILINRQNTFSTFRYILAHELAHVWQYSNNLSVKGAEIYFNGLTYEANARRHEERPHEIEAKRLGEELSERFKNVR